MLSHPTIDELFGEIESEKPSPKGSYRISNIESAYSYTHDYIYGVHEDEPLATASCYLPEIVYLEASLRGPEKELKKFVNLAENGEAGDFARFWGGLTLLCRKSDTHHWEQFLITTVMRMDVTRGHVCGYQGKYHELDGKLGVLYRFATSKGEGIFVMGGLTGLLY